MSTRVLITGAAGNVAKAVLPDLAAHFGRLRLTDISPIAAPDHEVVQCDLSNFDAVQALVGGCDAILHLGGYPKEAAWPTIRQANIEGGFNLFEAARREGVKRIVLASSTHVVGFEPRDQVVPAAREYRPDSIYGVSKLFSEGLASFYADRFGLEVMVLRIGLLAPKPRGWRNLANWVHAEDLAQLCRIGIEHPDLGYSIVYGVSGTDHLLFDNARAHQLGYRPKYSSAPYTEEMSALREDTDGFVGGPFVRGADQSSFE